MFQQEHDHIRRLLGIFDQLDKFRNEELEKPTSVESTQPTNREMRMPGQSPSSVRR